MICLSCNKRKARRVEPYGYLPCLNCIRRQRTYQAKETIEITTGEIKESRKKYKDDILQKFRGDTASKEYISLYGSAGLTKEQIKNARNVWTENSYYKEE